MMLAACSGGNTGKDAAGEKQPQPQTKEPVEITFFYSGGDDGQERFDLIYGSYIRKAFPDWKISYMGTPKGQTVEQVLSLNPKIDVVYSGLSTMQAGLIDVGLAYDIEPLIKQNNYNLSVVEPTFIDMIKQVGGGKLYGLPEYSGTVKLMYNKDLFDKFGVPYPKDGMTWDDAYELAKKMTRSEGGIQYRGLGIIFDHYVRFNQLSAGFVDPKTEKAAFVSDSKWQQVVTNAIRFNQIPGNGPEASTQARNLFEKEKSLAMIVTGNAVDGTNWREVNFDFAQLPTYTSLPGVGAQGNPNFFAVSSTSKFKNEAFQAIAYLTSKEYQLKNVVTGREPSIKDQEVRLSFGKDDPVLKTKNIKGYFPAKFANPSPRTKYDSIGLKYILQEMNNLASGKTADVNTALRTAADLTDKDIAAQKASGK
jgi:multiple sugar transport system substrate-binding protein